MPRKNNGPTSIFGGRQAFFFLVMMAFQMLYWSVRLPAERGNEAELGLFLNDNPSTTDNNNDMITKTDNHDGTWVASTKQSISLGGQGSKEYQKYIRALQKLGDASLRAAVDPLSENAAPTNVTRVDVHPKVEYLGILIDAGRHYYPIDWLKRLIVYLHRLHYNLIHFRLTDDQAFNVRLNSYPELAFATPTAANKSYYTPDELWGLVKFAKKFDIVIIPEINVPGHAGSWGGIPDLIVQCPDFICTKGYGVPVNIEHPHLKTILKGIISEVLEIFDNPPFLHLGGDEVSMARECFEEAGKKSNNEDFEIMLRAVLQEIGYPENQVLRFEDTGQLHGDLSSLNKTKHLRAGAIEHYWHDMPGMKSHGGIIVRDEPPGNPVFASTGLYMDTNHDAGSPEIFEKAISCFQLHKGPRYYPKGIIVGAFELGPETWVQRNVATRLIVVAMGAAQLKLSNNTEIMNAFTRICLEGLALDPLICDLQGFLAVPLNQYQRNWSSAWQKWKNGICERLTVQKRLRTMKNFVYNRAVALEHGSNHFWDTFMAPLKNNTLSPEKTTDANSSSLKTGIILDLSNSLQSSERLLQLLNGTIAPLSIDLAQIRLADNYAFAVGLDKVPIIGYSPFADEESPTVFTKELATLSRNARHMGVELYPEISVSTDGGGWIASGMVASCAKAFCDESKRLGMITSDIGRKSFLPILYSVLRELVEAFLPSSYIHLGSDERVKANMCFLEDGRDEASPFPSFESNLTMIMEKLLGTSRRNIIRWENEESIHYPDRTGDITHYRSTYPFKVPTVRQGEPFFVTIDLLGTTSFTLSSMLFKTYQNTRALRQLAPQGIFAEVRLLSEESWSRYKVDFRLIAFVLGTNEEQYNQEEFGEHFQKICRKAQFRNCSSVFEVFENSTIMAKPEYAVESVKTKHAVCNEFTQTTSFREMKGRG